MTMFDNPCLLQTLIISIAIVIVVMLVPFIIMICKKNSDQKVLFGLYFFLASLFLFFGICIFSFCFKNSSKVLEFISLVSAIVSIILAVITIVYSYYTSGTSSRNIENVQKSANELKETATNMAELYDDIAKTEKNLSDNIVRIFKRLDIIEKHTKSMTNYIIEGQQTANIGSMGSFDFDKILEKCPNVAIMFLYACGKFSISTKIMLAELFDDNPILLTMMYITGFSAILKMMGWVVLEINPEDISVKVEYIDSNLVSAVNKQVKKREEIEFIKKMQSNIDNKCN